MDNLIPYAGLVVVFLSSVFGVLSPYLSRDKFKHPLTSLWNPRVTWSLLKSIQPVSKVVLVLAVAAFLISVSSFHHSKIVAAEQHQRQQKELKQLGDNLEKANRTIENQRKTILLIKSETTELLEQFSPYDIQYSIYIQITDIRSADSMQYLREEAERPEQSATAFRTTLVFMSDEREEQFIVPVILRKVTVPENNPTVVVLSLIPKDVEAFQQRLHLFLGAELGVRRFEDIREIYVDTDSLTLISGQKNIGYRVEFRIREHIFHTTQLFEEIQYGLELKQIRMLPDETTEK